MTIDQRDVMGIWRQRRIAPPGGDRSLVEASANRNHIEFAVSGAVADGLHPLHVLNGVGNVAVSSQKYFSWPRASVRSWLKSRERQQQ